MPHGRNHGELPVGIRRSASGKLLLARRKGRRLPRNPQRHHLQPQGLPVAGQLSQSGLHLAADMDVRRRSLLPAGRGCTPRLEHGRHGRKPLQRRYPHVVLPVGRAERRQISVRQQKHSGEISRLGAGRLDRESEQRHRQVGRRRP